MYLVIAELDALEVGKLDKKVLRSFVVINKAS